MRQGARGTQPSLGSSDKGKIGRRFHGRLAVGPNEELVKVKNPASPAMLRVQDGTW
jgi:hypothetical protein